MEEEIEDNLNWLQGQIIGYNDKNQGIFKSCDEDITFYIDKDYLDEQEVIQGVRFVLLLINEVETDDVTIHGIMKLN